MQNYCKIFKSSTDGKVSFLITQKLLDSAYEKARTAKKKGMVVISIQAEEGFKYVLECVLTKEKS